MPAALTLILICPWRGSGGGTGAHCSTSGGPYPVITTALVMVVPSFLVAASVWPRTVTSAWSSCRVCCWIDCAGRRGRRVPAPFACQICRPCRRGADGRAGPAPQGQPAQGGDPAGPHDRAPGTFGLLDDPANPRAPPHGTFHPGAQQGQA